MSESSWSASQSYVKMGFAPDTTGITTSNQLPGQETPMIQRKSRDEMVLEEARYLAAMAVTRSTLSAAKPRADLQMVPVKISLARRRRCKEVNERTSEATRTSCTVRPLCSAQVPVSLVKRLCATIYKLTIPTPWRSLCARVILRVRTSNWIIGARLRVVSSRAFRGPCKAVPCTTEERVQSSPPKFQTSMN